jgi:hypothetical protein
MAMAQTDVASLRDRPAFVLGGLGLLSGLCSAAFGYDVEPQWLKPIASVFFLEVGAVPIGLFFGAAMALGMVLLTRNLWALPAVVVTTMYAWSAAIRTALWLNSDTGSDFYLVAGSLAAGAVGAGITHLGCAIFAPGLRRPARIVVTCAVGAAAGMLFYLGERSFISPRVLYAVWQPAVAFCIGLAMAGASGVVAPAITSAPR